MNNIKNNLDGWLVINKELGMTSSQVVNIVKKTLNVKKVGHAVVHPRPGILGFSESHRS